MFSGADLVQLRRTAIRGRVALALTCVERALDQFAVRDERISELVEVFWRFVEDDNLAAVDDAWRRTRAAGDLLDAVDKGRPIPASYGHLPKFLPRVLYDTLEIGMACMYQRVSTACEEESFDLTVRVVDMCADNGVAAPPLDPFARLPPDEDDGWGRRMPRTYFRPG